MLLEGFLIMTKRCYDEAKQDCYMLHETTGINPPMDFLVGSKVIKAYQDPKTPYVLTGLLLELPNGTQFLVVPTSPGNNDGGWLSLYEAHIPLKTKTSKRGEKKR